jgi:hypothetical protein
MSRRHPSSPPEPDSPIITREGITVIVAPARSA